MRHRPPSTSLAKGSLSTSPVNGGGKCYAARVRRFGATRW
jgi:hypothetical protein